MQQKDMREWRRTMASAVRGLDTVEVVVRKRREGARHIDPDAIVISD